MHGLGAVGHTFFAFVGFRAACETCTALSAYARISIIGPFPDTIRPRAPPGARIRPHECILHLIPLTNSHAVTILFWSSVCGDDAKRFFPVSILRIGRRQLWLDR